MALLTFAQQKTIKPITQNSQGAYAQLELETEAVELRKLVGLALLQDLQKTPTTPENIALLDGANFMNCKGQTIRHEGLRYVLAYLTYARYVINNPIKDTFTGHQYQDRPETRRIDHATQTTYNDESKEIALTEWENVRDFLNQNKDNYPLWERTDITPEIYSPTFHSVRKTKR